MPEGFDFFVKENSFVKKAPEFWLPLVFTPGARVRGGRSLSAIGVLKPGVTFEQATRRDERARHAGLNSNTPISTKAGASISFPCRHSSPVILSSR